MSHQNQGPQPCTYIQAGYRMNQSCVNRNAVFQLWISFSFLESGYFPYFKLYVFWHVFGCCICTCFLGGFSLLAGWIMLQGSSTALVLCCFQASAWPFCEALIHLQSFRSVEGNTCKVEVYKWLHLGLDFADMLVLIQILLIYAGIVVNSLVLEI